ncbi:MAG: membrane protein insertase YidC, partial [Ralstonia sp.]
AGDVPKAATEAAAAGTQAAPATGAATQAPASEKIVVTTDVVRATIDTAGAIVSKLELLTQKDHDGNPMVLFDRSMERTYLARSGIIGGDFPNHTTLFTASAGPRDLGAAGDVSITLTADKGGAKLVKTYVFKRGSYVIDTRFDVTNDGTAPINPTLYMELARDGGSVEQSRFYSTFTGPAVYTDTDHYHKITFSDIDKGKAHVPSATDSGWVAMVQHYFASAWIPAANAKREFYVDRIDNNFYRVGMQEPLGTVAPGASVSATARLFAGPQEARMLEAITPGLDLVKDYGWLTVIAKPLFWLLEKIHALLGNWGWSIVALTVLVKLVFFPLSATSYRSMAKMKDLQPRMTSIRERHKGDPQKMNQEMMTLYRTEKVNPLGGCLPIVIQIPVFMSLYWALLSSVERRGAPWLGWVHDLASPDPFYILPILMAVSMFVQTKLNPTPPDPVQAKMMLFMPLAFSVMFFFFPAGLVLYWVVNNVLSIAQQWSINRMLGTNKKAAAAK